SISWIRNHLNSEVVGVMSPPQVLFRNFGRRLVTRFLIVRLRRDPPLQDDRRLEIGWLARVDGDGLPFGIPSPWAWDVFDGMAEQVYVDAPELEIAASSR